MPTRKISDENERPCSHHDHNPPSHMVFEPGLYEHECPSCKKKVQFRVQGTYLKDDGWKQNGPHLRPDGWMGIGGDGDTRGRREW